MQKKYFCIRDKCTLSEDFVGGREEGVFSNKATYVALLGLVYLTVTLQWYACDYVHNLAPVYCKVNRCDVLDGIV